MTRFRIEPITFAFILAAVVSARGGEVAFKSGPEVKRNGSGANVSFSVSGPTDVEVAVIDAGGKVVRHLAAGVLGGKKPAPAPLKAGLTQKLVWDGRDDCGKPAMSGPYRVRVRLGLTPRFGRAFGGDPARHMKPLALGCGPGGEMYLMSMAGAPSGAHVLMDTKVYDRNGKFLRQLMPYPANLPPEKRKAVQWIRREDGSEVPVVYHTSGHTFYPEMGGKGRQCIMVRPDGKVAITNSDFNDPPHPPSRRLLVLGPEGGPGADYLGPRVTRDKVYGWPMTALSPDGKTIYITGTRRGSKPVPAVFKTTWDNRGDPEVFVGSESKPGSDERSLAEPRGVAVDGAGNVYVCDHMNDRVSVFSPEGKPLARIPAQYADLVSVHPKTGAVYVLCTKSNRKANPSNKWKLGRNFMAKKLLKFESYRAEKPVAQMVLPNSPAPPLMALDSSGEEAVLWLTRLAWTPPGKGTVRRIVDKGKAFEDSGCPITEGLPKWAISTSHLDICADDFSDEVYVSEGVYVATPPGAKRFDGLTGKFLGEVVLKGDKDFLSKKVRASWGQPTFSWDGGTVLWNPPSEWVYRFGRDGSPAPWTGGGTHIVAGLSLGHIRARGLAAAPDGGFYILHQSGHRKTRESFASRVGPGGEVLRREFIKIEAPVGGIRVDLKGNIYVGASVKPKGRDLPAGLGQQLPGTSTSGPRFYYAHAYGTLLKFGPEGGRVTAGAGDLELIPNKWKGKMTPARAEGVLWTHDGLSPIHSSIWSEELTCRCENPRFDVDRYGRVFVPDALRFSVAVLDTDGNPITRFGSYGNVDSRREGGGLNEPEIPLAWAHAVEVTEKMAYVADMVNHRIVAVKLTYAAEKTCPIR